MKIFAVISALLFFCASLFAQQQYTFTNYTQEEGLPSGTIRAIYKDTTGYLWLTSEEGVSRFDGYNFKVFRHNPDDNNSLPDNFAWYGAPTGLGDIYFETQGRYCKYNPASESFTFNTPFGDSIKIFSVNEAKGIRDCYWVTNQFAIFRISKTGSERFAIPFEIDPRDWISVPSPDNRVVLFNRLKPNARVLLLDYQTKKISEIKILGHEGMEDTSAIADVVFTGNNFYLFNRKMVFRFDPAAKSFVWYHNLKCTGNFDYGFPPFFPYNDTLVVVRSNSGFLNIFNIRTGEEKLVYLNKRIPEADVNDRTILSCAADTKGGLWMGTSELGIVHYNLFTGELEQYIHEPGNSNSLQGNFVEWILPDESGVIWAACVGHGLIKMEPVTPLFKTAVPIVAKNSTNRGQGWSANIRCFLEKDDGYWIATLNGVFSYSNKTQQFSEYLSPVNNLNYYKTGFNKDINYANPFGSLAYDHMGNIWIGTWFGELIVYNTKLNKSFPLRIPEPVKERNQTRAFRNLYCDTKNRMWISTGGAGICIVDCNTLNLEKINEIKFEYNFPDANDSTALPQGSAFVVTEDVEGNIWAGTETGLCRYNEQTKKWKRYNNIPGNQNSIHNSNIRSMCLDKKGTLWIGTNGGGLNRYNKEQDNFTHFTTENGLINDQIYSLACDDNGMLWMGTNHGLCRFNPSDYSCKNFTEKDGIQNYEYNTGAAIKLKDGTLLFGGVAGYNIIDPNKIENKKLIPPVVISSFKIFDRETPTANGHLKLNYKENSFAFEFAALSYYRNQENHYAYKLEGVDRDWIFSDTRRYVSYSQLKPGSYTFKVKASNNDGVWNEKGAQLEITITPPWWETTWARILFALIVVGSAIGYYRYRTHALRARHKELETEVEKATITIRKQKEAVEAEKRRSDELLLNILPSEIANELKEKGSADAKHFDEVTVLFTDFKNFTSVAEKLSAQELVNEINYCYSEFDKIISKHGIEKIKTIGDAYMCAGGLPVPNKTNAEDTVKAAMEIRDFMKSENEKHRAEGRSFFEIRIGLHTGPVVAGIVGIKKFAYDIWGDTVNIAARMEQNSEAGKINISGTTYELVKDKFNCIYRGKISAKNKGEIDMYFVEQFS